MNNKNDIKVIVVSAINFFEGGPLSILNDCLVTLNEYNKNREYKIFALVHDVSLFSNKYLNNINFIEFRRSRKSYLFRLYYEYFYFKKFAKKENVYFWLSLHDITPNLVGVKQAVYCHNPTIFSDTKISDFFSSPKHFLFTLFYEYLYKINIHRNTFVIVQQKWIKIKFAKMFSISKDKIIVAPPHVTRNKPLIKEQLNQNYEPNKKIIFIYPAYPRVFKNFEILCKAAHILTLNDVNNFEIILTISGNENSYSKKIFNKYKSIENIKFIGQVSREELFQYYHECDCLLFPSKLETWGLPLTEFKNFQKPIFVSNLEYAKETIGLYDKVCFFDCSDSNLLSKLLLDYIKNYDNFIFNKSNEIEYDTPFAKNWVDLFDLIL